ncbi:MAG TPA: DUF2782 domain-containing protein [Rhodocyclaceae bacterium]
MRRLLPILLFAVTLPVLAEKPANLEPLPAVPPPPPGIVDPDLEPQVTITKRGEDKVEEFRANGRLYMIKVTPPHGLPYYLIDDEGNGSLVRRDTIGPNLKMPSWVIKTWD